MVWILKHELGLRSGAVQWPLINASNVGIDFVSTEETINVSVNLGGLYNYNIDSASFANINSGGSLKLSQPGRYDFYLNNTKFSNSSTTSHGGTLYMDYVRNGYLKNNSFTNSYSTNTGGAIYSSGQPIMDIIQCEFENCTSGSNGGAIYISGHSKLDIFQCEFKNCTSGNYGGSVHINSNANFNISKCKFENSKAKSYAGGAIYIYYMYFLSDCQFISCSSNTGGGAIFVEYGRNTPFFFRDSIFYNCSSNGDGGAMFLGNQYSVKFERLCFNKCTVSGTTSKGTCINYLSYSSSSPYLFGLEFISFGSCGKSGYGNGILCIYSGQQNIINNNFSYNIGLSKSVLNTQPYYSLNIQYSTMLMCSSTELGSSCMFIESLSTTPMALISFCNIIGNAAPYSVFYIKNYGSRAVFQFMRFINNSAPATGLVFNEYISAQGYVSILNSITFNNSGGLGYSITSEAVVGSNAPTYTLTFHSTIFCETFEQQNPLEVPCPTIPSFLNPPTPTQCAVNSENPMLSLNIANIIHVINPLTSLLLFE